MLHSPFICSVLRLPVQYNPKKQFPKRKYNTHLLKLECGIFYTFLSLSLRIQVPMSSYRHIHFCYKLIGNMTMPIWYWHTKLYIQLHFNRPQQSQPTKKGKGVVTKIDFTIGELFYGPKEAPNTIRQVCTGTGVDFGFFRYLSQF